MNLPFIFRITGSLNQEALETALEHWSNRHDVLHK
jgi:hypothetical protein